MHIFILNINKLTFWIFFSFLWFYLVFNQVGFLKTVFRWYILWHALHLVLSCKVVSYDPLLEKNIYYSSTNTLHWNITKKGACYFTLCNDNRKETKDKWYSLMQIWNKLRGSLKKNDFAVTWSSCQRGEVLNEPKCAEECWKMP